MISIYDFNPRPELHTDNFALKQIMDTAFSEKSEAEKYRKLEGDLPFCFGNKSTKALDGDLGKGSSSYPVTVVDLPSGGEAHFHLLHLAGTVG